MVEAGRITWKTAGILVFEILEESDCQIRAAILPLGGLKGSSEPTWHATRHKETPMTSP